MDAPNMHFLGECIIYNNNSQRFYCAPLFWFRWPGPVGLARGATMKNKYDAYQYKY